MAQLTIRIQSLEDVASGVPAIEGLTPENTIGAKLQTIAILEAGMQSGKTSVALHFVLPDGKNVFVETSGELLRAAAQALEGAEQRFEILQRAREQKARDN